jgi:SAM-dependent methyltransferase
MDDAPRLYGDLARWFPLLSPPGDAREEAATYLQRMADATRRPLRTVLELGSGGGHNALHLKGHVTLTLVDRSEAMLAESRRLNPEVEHRRGDMLSLRLDRAFDAVFVHDAASHVLDSDQAARLAATCRAHLEPGGVALVCPDHLRETFAPSTTHGGRDADDGRRGLRYLEWVQGLEPDGTRYLVHMAYLLREGATTRCVSDVLRCGALPRATWLAAFRAAGFDDAETVAVPGAGAEPGEAILAVA